MTELLDMASFALKGILKKQAFLSFFVFCFFCENDGIIRGVLKICSQRKVFHGSLGETKVRDKTFIFT